MKKGKNGKSRKSYRSGRRLKKALSAVLLVLLILAFIGIRWRENGGTFDAAGPEQTQEAASRAGTEESQDAGQSGSADQSGSAGQYQSEASAAEQPESSSGIPADKPDEKPAAKQAVDFSLDMVPPFSGQAYADINGDVPFFTEEEMTSEAFHEYWPLDELGRCTGAYACVGPETLPKQKRGDISEVRPTGWNTNRYSDIDGEILFNRCHMIGHMLTGQDANERNLITGTRYMNVEGMLPFEESVVMYVEGTGHHVMYRVRPYFDGDNLVCTGVLMEARSVEDPLVQFCAFCYNVQPGFEIDYATGDNWRAGDRQSGDVQRIVADPDTDEAGTRQGGEGETAAEAASDTASAEDQSAAESAEAAQNAGTEAQAEDASENEGSQEEITYILNTNTHKFHMPYCDSVKDMKEKNKQETTLDREAVISQGYSPCNRCHP